MKISEIQITPIKPNSGHIAFVSCVINEQLYIGSIGVHRLLDGSGYRITYPTKKIGSRYINYYHPITKETGWCIEKAVISECKKLFEGSDEKDGRYDKATNSNA